jgi:hypothetical protein
MSVFTDAARTEASRTLTTNGALAINTTGSSVLDLFAQCGAMRENRSDLTSLLYAAFNESPDLTTKITFYCRDARGGQGERETARQMWHWLATNHTDVMRKNLKYVPFFGRWDDMYVFIGTPVENDMWQILVEQISEDIAAMNAGKSVSLAAKWVKSVNTSSKESVRLGYLTAKKLGMDARTYQKTIAKLRKYIDVTEVKMSGREWSKINYEAVPSYAMKNYAKAFSKHDNIGFSKYMEAVKSGAKKINASTLFPYDIIERYENSYAEDDVLEAQWKALPNYVEGENNILVMADTSGSMYGRPMDAAIGLAIYFAERNKGDWHNLFMTFSERPKFIELREGTLRSKINKVRSAPWGNNTNLEAAFELVLKTAIKNNIASEDLPKTIVVITDMQMDYCVTGFRKGCLTFYDQIKQKYNTYGYTLPEVVFWNVNSYGNFQARAKQEGVRQFSGMSTAIFKNVLESIGYDSYEAMIKALSDERYAMITA